MNNKLLQTLPKHPVRTGAKRSNSVFNDRKFTYTAKPFYRTLTFIFCIFTGFVLGLCSMPYDVYPCGTALVCAMGRYAPGAFIGSSLASLLRGHSAAGYLAVNALAFFARAIISGGFCESRRRRCIMAAVVGIIYGCGISFSGGFESEYILAGISYGLCLPAVCICLCRASEGLRKNTVTADTALCVAVLLGTYALARINFGNFSPAAAFCGFAVLFAAYSGGSLYGIFMGALCGIAWHGAENGVSAAISLAFAGALGGIFAGGKKSTAAIVFSVGFFCAAFYFDLPEFFPSFLSCAVGCTVYAACSQALPKLFIKKQTFIHTGRPSLTWEKLSGALSYLSDTVYNVSDKLKYPGTAQVRECIQDVFAVHCGCCAMYDRCYSRKIYRDDGIEDIICTRLCSGGLKKSDFPDRYADSCIKIPEITEKLNDSYARLVQESFRDNKTEILASEYSTMARLFKYTSQKVNADISPDRKLQEAANAALCAIGLRFSSIEAYGERIKTVEVHGIKTENFPCTSEELAAYMSEKCGYLFGEPEYTGLGEKMTLKLTRKRKFKPEYARSAKAKGGSGVNGDSVNFFETDEHYFYALISDGMGSGRSAALTSRLTSVFIEKLLTTGAHRGTTLEMLNNLLLSKNDESFATVDLLEIDLLTGDASFIKAGAAPAYILRAAKLYKIASFTPPAGIIRSFNAEKTCFSLERGDTVLMLSDGIVQNSDDAPWLCEMLSFEKSETPSSITEKVLAKACRINARDDDMTCVAVKVF